MAGKISEYIQIAVKKASDLLDMTVDVGGGLLETRSITALNFFKPRSKTVALMPLTTTVDFGFETSASINITKDAGLILSGVENGGVYQLILHADATPRIVTLGTSFGESLTFEDTTFTTIPNRAYLIEIFVSATGLVTHRRNTFIRSVAGTITGTNEVVFKTNIGYFTRTLTSISAWIKSALYTSEILNDSNLVGLDLNDILNTAEAVEVQTVQDGDIIAMARDNNGVSENVFVKTENAKPYFAGAGNGTFIYVSTADEFVAAIGMEYSIIEICVTKPITVNPFSNVYADNVYLTGCEITLPDGVILCNKTSTNTTTNYLIDNALLYDVTDPIESVIVVTALGGMARTWNITVREFKTTRPLGVLVTTGCQLNLITGNTLKLDAQQLVGSYTATVDATLDLGQEDIRLDGSNVLDVSPAILPGDKMLIKKGNYNFELVDVAAFGGVIRSSERYSETAVVDATGGYGPFNFASIPNEFEIENIEIYADVDNTPSIFIKFENQTDVFSGIIGSTTLIFGKTLLIEGATTIGCFSPYTPISTKFTYRVRNVYGSARRLQLGFGSMGNPAHYTIKTTFRRIP